MQYDATRMPDTPATKTGTPEDQYFKRRMRNEGWTIEDNETVTEFVVRTGGLFHITYDGERLDN